MKLIFMGTPDFAVKTFEALCDAGHEILFVVTQPDKPVGRKMELRPTAVKQAALDRGIRVYQPAKLKNNQKFIQLLRDAAPDAIIVAAYGKIIPAEILAIPRYGCLNVHASLLPKYRGAAPIQWAVIDGEEKSGVSIMQMNEGLDTGDIIARREVVLAPDETGGSLFDRLAKTGAELLVDTLPEIEQGNIHPEKQPAESPTPYARMIKKEDGLIDWTQPAARIERLVRGLSPWPGTYTHLGKKTLKIWKSSVCEGTGSSDADTDTVGASEPVPEKSDAGAQKTDKAPGTVLRSDDRGLLVQTGDGALLVTELQLEGKKRMKAADFLRGHSIEPGTLLGGC